MPTFNKGPFSALAEDMDIDVDKFFSACNHEDKEELIATLIEDGYLKKDCLAVFEDYNYSATEAMFVDSIDKIRNKWNMLTKEEEEFILNLAKKF